ncbi:hypothetical protein LUZ61_008024 [Rhynchospora tenuis]|uniref:Uncharacterized protein n=1 Tax=Rhynchospora tenuis TaxID=198213 RepID=A0AAD6EX48_9POAL|nr:hypothetical protein LUZ61_008024 [Rhynchospora tenuis]
MSKRSEIRFNEREDLNIMLGMREVGESSSRHNSLWMAHWTNSTQNKRSSISHTENTKTRVAEQLVIGMNRRATTSSNLLRTSTNENLDFYFNSVTQKAMVSSNTEAYEVLGGSDHFPMYNIKRKIESILNPKGKAQFTDRISELNLTFHSSEEFHFEKTPVQNPKNHQLTALESCSCTEEGNVSTSSQIKCPSNFTRTQSMNSTDNLSDSSKRKAMSLFEMLSMPTESFGMAQSKRKSKSCEEDFEGHDMISKFRKLEGRFEQSDALLFGSAKDLGSVKGLTSSRAQKVMAHRNSTISNSTATAYPEKSHIGDEHIRSLNTIRGPGPSQTLTINATKSLYKTSAKPNADSNSMEMQQKPSDQEAHGNRWLKRLRHDISSKDVVLHTKRLKVENNISSQVSTQQLKSWIQRWCVKKVPSEGGENFENGPKEELEGRQFPSIAAMAMMGKAMNKFRPGEFQRRGPSVVWNNNEV